MLANTEVLENKDTTIHTTFYCCKFDSVRIQINKEILFFFSLETYHLLVVNCFPSGYKMTYI